MSIDLQKVRADTPGCENGLFFGSAGSSLMPKQVLAAQTEFLALEAHVGGYHSAQIENAKTTRCYTAIAELLNCDSDEIAITENATVSWNMVFHGLGC